MQQSESEAQCAACQDNETAADFRICLECLEWYGHGLPTFKRKQRSGQP